MVSDLHVDVLAGTPFMATNDISIHPAMQQITIKGTSITYYSHTSSDSHHHHVRRTHAKLADGLYCGADSLEGLLEN